MSFRTQISIPFCEHIINQPNKHLVQCVKSSLQVFIRAMPRSECNNTITDCDVVNVCINQVNIVNRRMIHVVVSELTSSAPSFGLVAI